MREGFSCREKKIFQRKFRHRKRRGKKPLLPDYY
jgi:hypothetical protein